MPAAQTMTPDFPIWYRTVSLGEDRERLQRRWKGIAELLGKVTRADIETMIRVVFRSKQPPRTESLARIRQFFKTADDLFEMHGNDRELQILCGATLAALFKQDSELAAVAALTVTTAAMGGSRVPDLPVNLIASAEQALGNIAEVSRRRPDLSEHAMADLPPLDFAQAVTKIQELPNFEGVAAAFTLAAQATRAAIKLVAGRTANAISAADDFIGIQNEELQMLWWLIGERSWDLDCAFSAMHGEAQPLILAKELADMTILLPGPPSTKALLSRAGLKERKKLPVPAAVNACDADWLKPLIDNTDPSPVTQPIHFAIQRKLETGDEVSWVPNWTAVSGVDSSRTLPVLELGVLFYRERLLTTLAKE